MPNFRYRALTQTGDVVGGVITASNAAEVARRIDYLHLVPIDTIVEEKQKRTAHFSFKFGQRARPEDVTIFTLDLALLLKAGARLDDALELLATDSDIDRLQSTISTIRSSVLAGESFAEALAVYPLLFPPMSLGGQAVAVLTSPPASNGDSVPIKVLEEQARHGLEIRRVRQALVCTLGGAGILTAISIALAGVGGAYLTAQHDDLSRQISRARTQAGARQAADSNSAASTLLTLEQRKHNVPATVMILDVLSRILPDHTYVTELRIEGEKLRVIGSTRDAPSLIGLIEQSGRFSRATFFAPTTRSPSDPGERFHIEAVIQPSAGSSS